MIAWRVVSRSNRQRDTTDHSDTVEAYLCSCGKNTFIVKNLQYNSSPYSCQACGNSRFYSAEHAWKNFDHFRNQYKELSFEFEYVTQHDEQALEASVITSLPYEVDFQRQEVCVKLKTIYRLSINTEGDITKSYALKFKKEIYNQLKENLLLYATQYSPLGIPNPGKHRYTLSSLQFFLKHKHLRSYELYYWERTEKLKGSNISLKDALLQIATGKDEPSIMSALVKNHQQQLMRRSRFYSALITAFFHVMQATDLLIKFLDIDFEYARFGVPFRVEKTTIFLKFLKRDYTEEQIIELFASNHTSPKLEKLSNLISLFYQAQAAITTHFIKVTCHVDHFDTEFRRCKKVEHLHNFLEHTFLYTKESLQACIETDEYRVQLPQDGKVFFRWVDLLHQDIHKYLKFISLQRTANVYFFFKKEQPVFSVEIWEGQFSKAIAISDDVLTSKERIAMIQWYNQFFCTKNDLTSDAKSNSPFLIEERCIICV